MAATTTRKRGAPGHTCLVEKQMKRRCPAKTVHFASSFTERTAENIFNGLSESEEQALRSTLWHTSLDTQKFMQEQVQTVQLLQAVQGNVSLVEPMYCARGFESFQSTSLRAELRRLRLQYFMAVFELQGKGAHPGMIGEAAKRNSSYAVQRARRNALQDEEEAQRFQRNVCDHPNTMENCFKTPTLSFQSQMSATMSLRHMIPKSFGAAAVSRQSLAQVTFLSHRRRNTVDVSKLREMNRRFLQGLDGGSSTLSSARPLTASFKGNAPSAAPSVLGNQGSTLDLLNSALEATE
mmetsp:Transcript_20005/g.46619  ORF Transcript_20005/g.46619 Transcript_20005/m.46619 type:complete len:294 (-) Transcript_20005:69-950(-)